MIVMGGDDILGWSRLWLVVCKDMPYEKRMIREHATTCGGLGDERTRLEWVYGDGKWLGSLPGWYCVNQSCPDVFSSCTSYSCE